MSSRRICETSWRSLKTSWRRLGKTSWRCLEDVLKTSWKRLENFLKTPWRRFGKTPYGQLRATYERESISLISLCLIFRTEAYWQLCSDAGSLTLAEWPAWFYLKTSDPEFNALTHWMNLPWNAGLAYIHNRSFYFGNIRQLLE